MASAQCATSTWQGVVVRVTDGDSIWVRPTNGQRAQNVRLLGIDAPEICQPGGVESRMALQKALQRQTVNVTREGMDDYGRPLVRIELRGIDIARHQVGLGWAWSYRWRGDLGPYIQEENEARAARRGLFGAADAAEPPRAFRQRHGPCEHGR